MFDKMIVSESSDFKTRRHYFMVSSLFVGILFLAAVVFSIYASDYGLGNNSFEISMFEISMVMAPTETPAEPAPPKPQVPASQPHSQTRLPSRRENMASVNEPTIVPATTSTTANNQPARPNQPFVLGPLDTEMAMPSGSGRSESGSITSEIGLSVPTAPTEPDPIFEAPPIKKPVEPKPTIKRSEGPINGKATHLPKPAYPAHAVALNIQGKVDVQVMIDESGKVISATAVSGHPFLKAAAEKAAWNAKFSTTYLSRVPVKVTGVIVYNFKK